MRLIIMYKNEMMECVEDVEQAHFYKDKVIMNKLPLNITELKLEKVSSINCQDISIEQVKQLQDQIVDLKAKLAESEAELEQKNKLIIQENGECILCGDCYCINNDVRKIVEENNKLKQRLAEKEEQHKQAMQNALNDFLTLRQELNQDKISFAVEQLNQFKSELVNKVSPVNLSYTEYVQEVFKKIDNQIKMLKEGNKNEN